MCSHLFAVMGLGGAWSPPAETMLVRVTTLSSECSPRSFLLMERLVSGSHSYTHTHKREESGQGGWSCTKKKKWCVFWDNGSVCASAALWEAGDSSGQKMFSSFCQHQTLGFNNVATGNLLLDVCVEKTTGGGPAKLQHPNDSSFPRSLNTPPSSSMLFTFGGLLGLQGRFILKNPEVLF